MSAREQESSAALPAGSGGADGDSGVLGKYLRLEELRWLRDLFFASRRIVEGQYAGRHCSSMRGHSVEFSDYRQYIPGDELGDIDWKIFGRSDRLFVKLFEQQSDMTVNLLVDGSASMTYAGYQGKGHSKFDHACRMAAAIGFLTAKQQDKVSFSLAQNGLSLFLRARGDLGHFCQLLRTMEAVRPGGKADLADALHQLAGMISRRGVLIVFTDLLEDDLSAVFDALSIFMHRGGEVIVFHVLHAEEMHLPDVADAMFIDSESGGRIRLNVTDVRSAYGEKLRHFLARCSAGCRGRGMDYNLVPTSQHYTKALSEYLFKRASIA